MDLKKIKKLGEGSFGSAYLVEDPDTKKQYVLKTIKHEGSLNEIDILTRIKPECQKYLSCIYSSKITRAEIMILMEYIPDTFELFSYLKYNADELNIFTTFIIIKRLLEGLSVLHRLGVVHRDIKPSNILIQPNLLEIHYIDYGFACLKEDIKCIRKFVGSPYYMSPEVYLNRLKFNWEILKSADIWALGISLMELVFPDHFLDEGVYPPDESMDVIMMDIEEGKGVFEDIYRDTVDYEKYSSKTEGDKATFFISIIRPMLNPDWTKRPSAKDMLKLIDIKAKELIEMTRPVGMDIPEGVKSQLIEEIALKYALETPVSKKTKIMTFGDDKRRRTI